MGLADMLYRLSDFNPKTDSLKKSAAPPTEAAALVAAR